jgi:hypothetical protein
VKRASVLLLVLGLLLSGSRPAAAQFVTLSMTASPGTMTINSIPAAGSQPNTITDAGTSYRMTSFLAPQKKLTAQLSSAMPPGVTLTATFNAAGGGSTSTGVTALDAIARDMVVNIGTVFGSTQTITYVLSATVAAGVIPIQTRTVTITVLNYP